MPYESCIQRKLSQNSSSADDNFLFTAFCIVIIQRADKNTAFPLVDVLGIYTPRNNLRTSKNDIADIPDLPNFLEYAR